MAAEPTTTASPGRRGPVWPVSYEWLVLLVFSVVSFVGVNVYIFPSSNHNVTVPFIEHILDPSLFPGDALIAEQEHFPTIYNGLLAWASRVTGCSVPVLFHALFAVVLFATFACFFRLALVLGKRRGVALFATSLFLFSTRCLGGVMSLEAQLMERSLVLPLELWAIAVLFERRVMTAFAAAGIAFLVHPLSGAYCFCGLLLGGALSPAVPWRRLLAAAATFVVLTLPVTIPKLFGAGPVIPLFADPDWLELLRMRSAPHIDVTSWPLDRIVVSILFALAFFALVRRLPPHQRHTAAGFGGAIVLLCIGGYVFVELVPISLAIQLQLFRSARFLIYIGLILLAAFLLDRRTDAAVLPRVFCVILLIAQFYTSGIQGYVLPAATLMILLWYPGINLLPMAPRPRRLQHAGAVVVLALICGGVGYVWNGGPWIGNAAAPAWVKVQTWARHNTPVDAAFIVPPYRHGFRLASRRGIYADWKDGTQAFFNPQFGRDWLERMQRLGLGADVSDLDGNGFAGDTRRLKAGYAQLDEADFESVADDMPRASEVYAVVPADHQPLYLPVEFESKRYRIHRIR